MTDPVEEISLTDLIAAVKRRKRIVLTVTACVLCLALLYAIFATPRYEALIVVQPQANMPGGAGGALADLAGQLGSVSSMVGLGGLGKETDQENNYLATLTSNELALKFISQYNVAPLLFPQRWDVQTRNWKPLHRGALSSMRLSISRTLARISDDKGWRPPTAAPTTWQLLHRFQKILNVKKKEDAGVVNVTIKYPDPQIAAAWANEYVALANSLIRARVVSETQAALAYLSQVAEQTSVTEVKDSTYLLIQRHLEEQIEAKSKPDFAFQVVDPAIVPGERSPPGRTLVMLGALVMGLLFGSLLAVFQEFFLAPRRRTAPVTEASRGEHAHLGAERSASASRTAGAS
ncbi:MAG TPA: Wzz/FepE/Etk N-terminal domain-containing protein [Steroidobacteraceae bacterium]|jgi:uncharacterized protein involved in exopolysaccharide biosynthesis|nr:Wzz/FepE/Etk N-terminal domain-containing protein [Steroidobacteraceae bacterium]